MRAQGNYYRMGIGNYRMGFKIESGNIIILRFMHRKDIYNYFPWSCRDFSKGLQKFEAHQRYTMNNNQWSFQFLFEHESKQ